MPPVHLTDEVVDVNDDEDKFQGTSCDEVVVFGVDVAVDVDVTVDVDIALNAAVAVDVGVAVDVDNAKIVVVTVVAAVVGNGGLIENSDASGGVEGEESDGVGGAKGDKGEEREKK